MAGVPARSYLQGPARARMTQGSRPVPATDPIRAEMIALLPRLRAFARSLTRAQDSADDLVQATCEKALRNLGAFTPGTRMDAWLFRIMRNAWIDTLRARRDHASLGDPGEAADPAGEDGRQVVMARLDLADVVRAVDALPEDQRSVLMLVCVEGMRYREAAAALGIPEGTVMSRLARGRAALARSLDGGGAAHPASGRTG